MIPLALQFSAPATDWQIQGQPLFLIITLLGLACFAYIVARRMAPMLASQRDHRFDQLFTRCRTVLQYWLGQWRHPRYTGAGIMHILIFAGFILLVVHTVLLFIPGLSDSNGIYGIVSNYAATVVFLCMVVAILRRLIFKPARYSRSADAIFLLGLIALLMAADSLFEGSRAAAHPTEVMGVGSLPWLCRAALASVPIDTLRSIYVSAYLVHQLAFFFLLCYRPFGIQFHVETSLLSIYFAKLTRPALKPVRWGVPDDQLDQVKSFGVKTFTDFTWKHILDFYSCADCGRCSDQCPANAVGRPLSPRMLTIKARDYCYEHYPVFSRSNNGHALIGGIYSEDEIWSCTTCGACEAECPLLVEYIDKIVDLRRGMVDDGNVPQSLQKPLKALESRGNPYGKMEKKRADWAKAAAVPILKDGENVEALYFVDSITSYDDRIQSIGRATARILTQIGDNFAVLGTAEKDSGHDVRRFGEETLFMALRDHNVEAIQASGAKRIVASDPHAFNALKHEYKDVPPVEHISQVIARGVEDGRIRFNPVENGDNVYAYHDPCYLGRHNGVYDAPRAVLDAIPGLRRVEMARSRDRSFCCGGGGLALFYEPKENERMGVKRVRMAADAGANVIVTACPFCMVNVEDAIKVAGLEGKMSAIDLTELTERQLVSAEPLPDGSRLSVENLNSAAEPRL